MKRQLFSTCIRTALLSAAIGVLSACNGSRDYTSSAPPIAMQPQGDQFTAAVQSVTSTAPDTTEPASLDAITLTLVDDKEPEAVI